MRVETANKTRGASLLLPATNEEAIITLLHNDLASIKSDYPDFGDKCWVNGYLEEGFATSVITSLEELPFPTFSSTDTQSETLIKAIDAQWKSPRVHLCFWLNTQKTPTAGATTNSPGNWTYIGKLSLLHSYGYPEQKHRWFDFLTDNIARKLEEGQRLGVSFQWVDRMFFRTLNNVSYTPNPDTTNPLILSRFSETLPTLLDTTRSYRLDGLRAIDGNPLPIEPVTSLTGTTLTVSFTNEERVAPAKIKAIITEVGAKQKLTAIDTVTIDASWTQEIVSLQPDFTPTPVIVQGTVQTVTRKETQNIVTVTTTRQTVLADRTNRISSRLTNRGATNGIYYKLGADVTTSPFIAAGTVGGTGGYHGIVSPNASADLPTGYTGTVSVITTTGQSSLLVEEAYNVSGA